MSRRITCSIALVSGAVLAGAYGLRAGPAGQPAAAGTDADRAAIRQAARDFEAAFAKGDAKALAALWAENGEARDADGRTFAGRAAIEKGYAEQFKAAPGAKLEVLAKSVRFPAKDLAVEEGLLRLTRGPKDLPTTTTYVAVHAREDGRWRVALSSEAGAGQDRLEDLDWLLGEWAARGKGQAVTFAFARDPKKAAVTGTFTRTPAGQEPVTGGARIALDPETGRIRSWAFEDDGAHSQSLWHRDDKGWVLDLRGVLADGTPTAERILLQRVGPDAITWRAVDRVAGDTPLPDTPPLRLTRAAAGK
ncbi:MAG: nuclear transport factor 2 family protein [Gemmataceae bacterium]|nr:nuclear transport factor 2 family protein [Gemmataceae bacterium]